MFACGSPGSFVRVHKVVDDGDDQDGEKYGERRRARVVEWRELRPPCRDSVDGGVSSGGHRHYDQPGGQGQTRPSQCRLEKQVISRHTQEPEAAEGIDSEEEVPRQKGDQEPDVSADHH